MKICNLLVSASACLVVVGLTACRSGSEGPHDHDAHGAAPAADAVSADAHAAHNHGEHSAAATTATGGLKTVKPSADYPLTTCVVSGEPLDTMGKPIAFEIDGQEVQFCCGGCVDEFKESPDKFLTKVREAGAN